MIIACIIISFIVGAFAMFCAIGLMSCRKDKKPRNKVRFYVVKEKRSSPFYEHENIWLFLGKPERGKEAWNDLYKKSLRILPGYAFEKFGLHAIDYTSLKFEDEPVELFLNLED